MKKVIGWTLKIICRSYDDWWWLRWRYAAVGTTIVVLLAVVVCVWCGVVMDILYVHRCGVVVLLACCCVLLLAAKYWLLFLLLRCFCCRSAGGGCHHHEVQLLLLLALSLSLFVVVPFELAQHVRRRKFSLLFWRRYLLFATCTKEETKDLESTDDDGWLAAAHYALAVSYTYTGIYTAVIYCSTTWLCRSSSSSSQ